MTQFGCILDQLLLNNETVYVMCFNSFEVIFDRSAKDQIIFIMSWYVKPLILKRVYFLFTVTEQLIWCL